MATDGQSPQAITTAEPRGERSRSNRQLRITPPLENPIGVAHDAKDVAANGKSLLMGVAGSSERKLYDRVVGVLSRRGNDQEVLLQVLENNPFTAYVFGALVEGNIFLDLSIRRQTREELPPSSPAPDPRHVMSELGEGASAEEPAPLRETLKQAFSHYENLRKHFEAHVFALENGGDTKSTYHQLVKPYRGKVDELATDLDIVFAIHPRLRQRYEQQLDGPSSFLPDFSPSSSRTDGLRQSDGSVGENQLAVASTVDFSRAMLVR